MEIGLYIHIPFCMSKCYYCDFLSFPRIDLQEVYCDALVKEIKNYASFLDKKYSISSVFIGGGTPTVLPPVLLDKICAAIVSSFRLSDKLEWTIEANPGTVTRDTVRIINTYPINRISMGLQSTNDKLLKLIGRKHTFRDWEKSFTLIKETTLCDVNADLMFALPTQTTEVFQHTLKQIVNYPLEHLSLYALIIEEGTRFYDLLTCGELNEADEFTDRSMYHYAKDYLKDKGFLQYEISNWAKSGKACRHNILYWERGAYIGMGLGAHSFFDSIRYHNENKIERYIDSNGQISLLKQDEEKITQAMAMQEFMFLGLRMTKGISIEHFYNTFKINLFDIYGTQLTEWIKQDILVKNNDNIFLSDYGMDICNTVFTSFL